MRPLVSHQTAHFMFLIWRTQFNSWCSVLMSRWCESAVLDKEDMQHAQSSESPGPELKTTALRSLNGRGWGIIVSHAFLFQHGLPALQAFCHLWNHPYLSCFTCLGIPIRLSVECFVVMFCQFLNSSPVLWLYFFFAKFTFVCLHCCLADAHCQLCLSASDFLFAFFWIIFH